MAGWLRRPECNNDIMKRLVCMQCRSHCREADPTTVRDLEYAMGEAKRCGVEPELVDLISDIAAKCIESCELNRYADRKNPCILVYNLATLPSMRARRIWLEAEELKNTSLLHKVCPDKDKWKVSIRFTVLNVNYDTLKDHSGLREEFICVVRKAMASAAGEGVAPDAVKVELWPGSVVPCTLSPPPGGSAENLRDAIAQLVSEGPAALSMAVAKAFGEAGEKLAAARGAGGEVHVGEIRQQPTLVSDRSDAIFKVCAHGAWLEQNTRDWDGAQGGTLTGTAWGYKQSMAEDQQIVDRFSEIMGFDECGLEI